MKRKHAVARNIQFSREDRSVLRTIWAIDRNIAETIGGFLDPELRGQITNISDKASRDLHQINTRLQSIDSHLMHLTNLVRLAFRRAKKKR